MQTNNRLRGALTKILDLTNSLDEECAVDPVEIRDIAKAALSEPIRNCDVGTSDEQAKRLREFCKKHRDGIRRCSRCPVERIFPKDCTLAWAQMPYEEGGAK